MNDHERIWLQHPDDAEGQEYGRMWAEDKAWPNHPEDHEPTKYIRVDLYDALADELARAREDLDTETQMRKDQDRRLEKAEAELTKVQQQFGESTERWADDMIAVNTEFTKARDYAERLAINLWEKHWKHDAPQWQPLPDLIGILTQIDNSIAGLTRAEAAATIERLTKERDEARTIADKALFSSRASAAFLKAETAELAKAREESEKWKFAFAAQSRKLEAVLYLPGVREELAALAAQPEETP